MKLSMMARVINTETYVILSLNNFTIMLKPNTQIVLLYIQNADS